MVETFLRALEEKLASMQPAERAVQMSRLVQLFKAARYMKEIFQVKGGLRFGAWLVEKSIAKTPPERIAQIVQETAARAKLHYVVTLINDAQAS